MLLTLKLKNFKQHEDLEVNFSGGLQAVRGSNEAGKSTLFEAIAYALYGSRALPMSLDETVTWGKPVGSLRVDLTFTQGKDTFHIYRGKSGAQLTGEGVTASGQAEVTAFVEKLFGASAQVGLATMLANQGALKDNLDSSAMPLIERLANMQLIDELVGKIQEHLPSGNTKGIESQLLSYVETAEPTLDTAGLEQQIGFVERQVVDLTDALSDYRVNREAALEHKQALAAIEQTILNVKSQRDNIQKQLDNTQVGWPVYDTPTPDLDALTAAVEAAQADELVRVNFDKFNSAVAKEYWPGTATQFVEKAQALQTQIKQHQNDIQKGRVDLATQRALLITETACGLCGKDLTDVPEVVAKNTATMSRIQALELDVQAKESLLGAAQAELKELERWDRVVDKVCKPLPLDYVAVDNTTVPPTLAWTGPAVQGLDLAAAKKALQDGQRRVDAERRDTARAEAAQALRADLQNQLAALVVPEVPTHLWGAGERFDLANALVETTQRELSAAKTEAVRLAGELQTANAVYAGKLEAWRVAKEKREELLDLLDKYNFNNGIVKKLREARPIVAKKLWAIVSVHISHYFSVIRGTASTVTRSEDGFTIDGKNAKAFSGSTKDALGLAIRLTLQKTFLPNVDFMLVDEPGAACDDAREAEMLGVLASCGLDQVILVTHSNLADSFASNVVTI